MLSELHIREFALIEDVRLELAGGMTVFSGETGAGKSILVDALGAAFGARASSNWIRHGADRAEITAILEDASEPVVALLREHDLDTDDAVMLRRVVRLNGSSRAYVNGVPVPARLLRQIGEVCLDLHGQHEHQALLHADFQRELLDSRVPASLQCRVREAWRRWKAERDALNTLLAEREKGVREEAWMREELKRLRMLELKKGLLDELQAEVESSRHFARIQEAVARTLASLEDENGGLQGGLSRCMHELEHVSEFSPAIRGSLDLLAQADAVLGEAESGLRALLDASFDQRALEAAQSRLLDVHEAMRRNRTDEDGLIALQSELEGKISRLDTSAWNEDEQRRRLAEAGEAYAKASIALSGAREKAARELARELRPFLDRLALAGMKVRIIVRVRADDPAAWSPRGFDEVTLTVASNPGEPFRELAAVASGGELSRFVLALKGCGALALAPQIAVFDEIDAGIGGETAWSVGELLAAMGHERQVLVVSHLPQVAACADHQLRIDKCERDGRTVSRVTSLRAKTRQEEIARMLGGANAKSRDHARQMLQRGAGSG